MIYSYALNVPITGSAGSAIGLLTTSRPLNGRLQGVYIDYVTQPATCDVTIKTTGNAAPSQTLLTLTNANSDGWFYPRPLLCNTSGVSLITTNEEFVIDDYIQVDVAQGDAGSVVVTLLIEKDMPRRPVLNYGYSYAAQLGAILDMRFQVTTGVTEINRGTGGSALNGTIGGTTTLGQTGKLGVNEAFLYDGATSLVTVPNQASLASLTTWTYVYLVNPATAGELTFGTFSAWGNGNGTDKEHYLTFGGALTSLQAGIFNTTPTEFITATTTGLSASAWSLVFWTYANAGDRKAHVYKGVSGAVNEFAYSAQPALTGTYKAPTHDLILGNFSTQALTFDGLFDWVLVFDKVLTSAEMLNLVRVTGV